MALPQRWQSGTALTLTMTLVSIAALPLSLAKPAAALTDRSLIAQRFPDSWRQDLPPRTTPSPNSPYPNSPYPPNSYPNSPYPNSPYPGSSYPGSAYPSGAVVPAGTVIYVQYDKDKVVLVPDETVPLTLTTARDVLGYGGTVLIPAGSEIKGKLKPASGGTQFTAEELKLSNGKSVDISAISNVISRTETVTKQSNPEYFRGAAIGAGAGAILGEIFGNIKIWQVLAGAGLGVLTEVFLLRHSEQVDVIVVYPNQDLTLRLQSDVVLN
jgi:hypothetical protein